jgi:hypothetical protein
MLAPALHPLTARAHRNRHGADSTSRCGSSSGLSWRTSIQLTRRRDSVGATQAKTVKQEETRQSSQGIVRNGRGCQMRTSPPKDGKRQGICLIQDREVRAPCKHWNRTHGGAGLLGIPEQFSAVHHSFQALSTIESGPNHSSNRVPTWRSCKATIYQIFRRPSSLRAACPISR